MNTCGNREANKMNGPIPWDLEVISAFLKEWLEYSTDLNELEKVIFPRSLVPKDANPDKLPFGTTLDNGNKGCSGANIWTIWTKLDGSQIASLLKAKAKLSLWQYKGETLRQ